MILKTENTQWGFWGTSVNNGYDPALTWEVASHFFAIEFELTPEQTRDVLDATFGRHLADDLSFGDPHTTEGIKKHLHARKADPKWRASFEKSISKITGKTFMPKATELDTLLTQIAHKYLGVETLYAWNADSMDFHEVAVWQLKAALIDAYNAGKLAK